MSFHLFDALEREASQDVAFAGNRIDRLSEKRSDDSAERALADPSARLLLIREGRLLLRFSPSGTAHPYFTLPEIDGFETDLKQAVLLGFEASGPILAVPTSIEPERLPETIKAIDFRSIYIQGLIDPAALGALAQGTALLAWHANHQFCGKCGHKTGMRAGGYKRRCTSCGAEHFPRTDPVVIMLAVTPDKCLLGRSPHFKPGMYSALAGFVEPGETIEAAVRRETFEEAGIRLGRVVYQASQPWPFPYSLMIGCFGEALTEDITADTAELEDCRWFSRDDLFAMMAGTHPDGIAIPPRGAIAHHLVRTWAEGG
ncbi:MAG: NAD(+) diphosphatase [Pseudaminobacter sp.]